jgi:sulfate adenylyltransferase/3'-phosphoadenosine 5'-phosphosulfate synthase
MREGFVIWLTGLSGAGKSTIAQEVASELRAAGLPVEVLDGDIVRQNLSQGLGFSREDRDTNIRRIAFVAQLLARNGAAVIVAAISPYRAARDEARAQIGRFIEVHVTCPLDELVRRDTKGLYAKALRGELANFTGVSDPYEPPVTADVVVDTSVEPAAESAAKVLYALSRSGYATFTSSANAPAPATPAPTNGHSPTGVLEAVLPAAVQAIPPHGGYLINRIAPPQEAVAWRRRAADLPALTLTPRQVSDVEMIAIGAFSPLTGFAGARDYDSILDRMRLSSGHVWPIPITLAVGAEDGDRLAVGQPVALHDQGGQLVAILFLEEKYRSDPAREALSVYGTTDEAHPGVGVLYRQGPILLAGPVTLVSRPESAFSTYRLDPADTRAAFAARGWRRVVGFQTRNPIHRAHEYIQKAALETMDGLLLHPLVGATKDDDVPAGVRMRCYEVLLERYYPKDRVVLAINPAAMRYAGPREAVLHAIVRQNYGCTHFIVGRDHAGVGSYYGPFDAQHIFDTFAPGELAITPLRFDNTFYCRACAGIVSAKTCPHDATEALMLSGTQVRQLLREGTAPPAEFTRPEVAAVLLEHARAQQAAGEAAALPSVTTAETAGTAQPAQPVAV